MITLIIIGYIIISLLLSLAFDRKESYGIFSGYHRGYTVKEAIVRGFLVIPAIILAIGIIYGVGYLASMLFVYFWDIGTWIYHNMP